MAGVQLFYTKFPQSFPGAIYNHYLNYLPFKLKEQNSRFRRWQDRHAHLFGKMLLLEGLKQYGYNRNVFTELKFNEYNRPYLTSELDFNISHSGEYVLCVMGENIRLGIDIEMISTVNFDDFKKIMTKEQWLEIQSSEYPFRTFFKYWTIKESVIKADSRGLSIPLLKLSVKDDAVYFDNQTWYLNDIPIDNDYCACLAIDRKNIEFEMIEIDFCKKGIY